MFRSLVCFFLLLALAFTNAERTFDNYKRKLPRVTRKLQTNTPVVTVFVPVAVPVAVPVVVPVAAPTNPFSSTKGIKIAKGPLVVVGAKGPKLAKKAIVSSNRGPVLTVNNVPTAGQPVVAPVAPPV